LPFNYDLLIASFTKTACLKEKWQGLK